MTTILNRNANNYEKNAHKMPVVYFKGGAVYFDGNSLEA